MEWRGGHNAGVIDKNVYGPGRVENTRDIVRIAYIKSDSRHAVQLIGYGIYTIDIAARDRDSRSGRHQPPRNSDPWR